MEKQLYLIKVGRFSYFDVDTMPLFELEFFYNKLVEASKPQEEE